MLGVCPDVWSHRVSAAALLQLALPLLLLLLLMMMMMIHSVRWQAGDDFAGRYQAASVFVTRIYSAIKSD